MQVVNEHLLLLPPLGLRNYPKVEVHLERSDLARFPILPKPPWHVEEKSLKAKGKTQSCQIRLSNVVDRGRQLLRLERKESPHAGLDAIWANHAQLHPVSFIKVRYIHWIQSGFFAAKLTTLVEVNLWSSGLLFLYLTAHTDSLSVSTLATS